MRRIIWLTLSLTTVLWLPSLAFAQEAPVKIGLLFPYTGPIASVGRDATQGFELYLGKIGGKAGGREIRVLKEDDEFKPDVGLTKAGKLACW